MESHSLHRARITAGIGALLATLTLAACGSDESSSDPGPAAEAPSYESALAQAPAELAALYENDDAILDGGEEEYARILASVRGYPAVVNNWASWCGPCRAEFPYFQEAAAEHLDEVAFLGVDSEDSKEAAETFLRDNPLPYPSVEAPEKSDFQQWTGESLIGYPNTLFYDRAGRLVYTHQGPYASEEDLAADIEKYALSS